jgi:hypothetical protein
VGDAGKLRHVLHHGRPGLCRTWHFAAYFSRLQGQGFQRRLRLNSDA